MERSPEFDPRKPRRPALVKAVLVRKDGSEDDVTITEISEGGFRLEVSATPRIGERVRLRAKGFDDLPAQIRWALVRLLEPRSTEPALSLPHPLFALVAVTFGVCP